jgi:NADPH-dependent glutamate synthase beta subunit-like oxidoreductase
MRLTRSRDRFNRWRRSKTKAVYSAYRPKIKVEADRVILAVGQRTILSYASKYLEIEKGLIIVDPNTQAASEDSVFAGGDATISGPLTVVSAIAVGRRAAVESKSGVAKSARICLNAG